MFTIDGTDIAMTRGDTVCIQIIITDASGETYTPAEGDSIRFAMKRRYKDPEPLIEKQIPNDTLVLLIEPEDTSNLAFGSYKYDIEITKEDGTVDTFIPRANFTILEEVY